MNVSAQKKKKTNAITLDRALPVNDFEMASSVADILNSGPVPLARVRDDARRTLVALLDAVRRFRGEREEEDNCFSSTRSAIVETSPVSTFFLLYPYLPSLPEKKKKT